MKFSGSAARQGRPEIKRLPIKTARLLTGAVLNTLLPPRCRVCGCSIARMTPETGVGENPETCGETVSAKILRAHLCAACAGTFTAVRTPLCTRCGKMFMSRRGPNHLCGHCSRQAWHFGKARSAGIFDRGLATLVHRFKYNGRTGLAKPLGMLMRDVLQANWRPAEIDVIVPVPLHGKRLRARGFNQSFLLAQTCSSDLAGWAGIPIEPDLVRRTRPTVSQTGLGRKERGANLKDAFRVSPGRRVDNLRLLLVDDVFTTGATVNECAGMLLKAGAQRVDVLTLARTHTGYGKLGHG